MEKVSERDALVKALEEWRDPITNKLLSLAAKKSLVTLFAAHQSERETRIRTLHEQWKAVLSDGRPYHLGLGSCARELGEALATPPGA